MFGWLKGRRKRDEELMLRMVRAAAEGEQLSKLRQGLAILGGAPIDVADDEALTAALAAKLASSSASRCLPAADPDDDVFLTGIYAMTFANHFSHLAGVSFEVVAPVAVAIAVGSPEEFGRSFNAICSGYNEISSSGNKLGVAIGQAGANWLAAPTADHLDRLGKLYELARPHVAVKE